MISSPIHCSRYSPQQLLWPSAVALALLSGCDLVTRDAGADQTARSLFEEVSRHQTEAFTSRLDPALGDSKAQSQIAHIDKLIPAGEPRMRRAVNTTTVMSAGGTTVLAIDQYDYDNRSALVQTRAYRAPDAQDWSVQYFNVQVATFDQFKANDFGLVTS